MEEYGRKVQFLRGIIETEKLPSAEKRLLAAELLAPDRETKAAHLITTNKYRTQMRQELLLSSRQRFGNTKASEKRADDGADVNLDITQNLLELTNNIKENMRAAQAIIHKDNETLTKVASGADAVSLKMQKNSDKLSDFVRKGFQCAIWVALVLVTLTFLMMVIFIRMFPKQSTQ